MSVNFIDAISKEEADANVTIKKLSELESLIADGTTKATVLSRAVQWFYAQ